MAFGDKSNHSLRAVNAVTSSLFVRIYDPRKFSTRVIFDSFSASLKSDSG